MKLTPEQRTQAETLLSETEAMIKSASDHRTRIYYEGKARGTKARMDDNPQTRYVELLDRNILTNLDSQNEKRRIDAIGYGDGFYFDEPGRHVGNEYLDFRYVVQPADDSMPDIGYVWMERKTGWRRDCLYIDYAQPDDSPHSGPSKGHFRFRQVPGIQFLGEPPTAIGVFPFEGNGINNVDIRGDSLTEACDRFFARFNVPKSRYSFG